MGSTAGDHDHNDPDPVTERVHDNSWSANLETPRHADDRELVIEQAIEAVEHTTAGNHVNLVTHGDHGHPSEYLHDRLAVKFPEATVEYVDQCGCGGHVTRVRRRQSDRKSHNG
ncbi:CGCGG family putative rSAM-modified RiPP protein [Natranaeroarchaeum aerophilus]|uniref:CGCGG family rSAM-modified RiPP protein n=1 Tax=Natranaeroarchaeum aerophilus TaxID=2917711 RepID=A0AAE3FN00_9EURY|nr:CGCGG family rSAM-modified RiPP protein [Natranaeroarchaeum aerophilus]MCL9812303.1 CGCGG family rSAM-modified RiPP protein [Natranaeroarchaeum aerophilus]